MIWDELCKLALLGTERGQLPPELLRNLEKIGVAMGNAPEQLLLESAALYHQFRRAGHPISAPADLQSAAAVPQEGRPAMPARLARQMQHIMQGRFEGALPECLALAAEHGCQLPAEQLPALFDLAVKSESWWARIRPLLGPRSFWLLRQNPDWASLAECEPKADWSGLGRAELLPMLRRLRQQAPETATARLQPLWPGLAYPEKQAVLGTFQHGLSKADEPFLEQAASDSRKEVRQAAMQHLLLLPGSAQQAQVFERACELLSLDPKRGLQVQYVKKLDQALKGYGIGQLKKSPYPGGQGAAWAFELLSKIPPQRWEAHFGRSTLDVLRAFAHSDQPKLSMDALAKAALFNCDHTWIEALIRHWWRTGNDERLESALGKALLSELPEAVFNDLLVQHLDREGNYLEDGGLALSLLNLGAHGWSADLGKQVMAGFRDALNGRQPMAWALWHYRPLLKIAAYRMPVALLPGLQSGWDERSPLWREWGDAIEQLLKVLAFRKDMRQAFAALKKEK